MNTTEMTASKLDLEAIEARASSATPGWWTWDLDNYTPGVDYKFDAGYGSITGLIEEDAEFIAHARADVPVLLAEVARLRNALEAAQSPVPTEPSTPLIAEAIEWADGFGESAMRKSGTEHDREMGVANIITRLVAALECK